MKRTANLPLALLVLLLAGLAVVAGLGATSARDLLHRPTSAARSPGVIVYQTVPVNLGSGATEPQHITLTEIPERDSSSQMTTGLLAADPALRPVGWLLWTSLPGAIIALAMLALMVGSVVTARRRDLYGRPTLRLLRVTGFVSLIGGPLAVVVQSLAQRWTTPQGYAYTPAADGWQFAALLVLLGCAFLAVRDVLSRTGALRAELEGVI